MSLHVNSPEDIIKVSLVDYPEDVTNELKNKFDKYIFENRSVECVDERGIHFILMRVDLILECFERKQPAAWIDTDVVVRGDLKPFLDIEHNQLKILFRGDNVPEESRFNAGIMNVGYSLKTHAFIKRWRERLSRNMVWGMGQLELYNSYVEHRSNIELVKMPKSFNDLGDSTNSNSFADDSLMWHSKLKHFNNPKFQNEFQKYLNLYLTK
jgi:hypothetical protein